MGEFGEQRGACEYRGRQKTGRSLPGGRVAVVRGQGAGKPGVNVGLCVHPHPNEDSFATSSRNRRCLPRRSG
ncbi:hypothetical protein SAMN02787144_1004376 [Streptomyces atratus]|uniref:Uncharacterized protein n=1 Tax=Streptomyces atratus TaxID=1893 RepID=A0A1K1YN61_STRAR|nr:hypothetical protein SAMN02787144_1004376 [Streptomyces atratus]